MRKILILGAGKSSVVLIDYLVEHSQQEQWQVTVADITVEQAIQKTKGRENTAPIGADLSNETARRKLIEGANIVISMLPAALHLMVASDCLQLKKNLVTPSYISDQMHKLDKDVVEAGLVFMNEMGLDPGIDHMSAMQIIDALKKDGKRITGFESHCGGLVAPESDDNPWHYKFTWNPRNLILAGQGEGGIHYLKDGKKVDLKYEELFANTGEIEIEGNNKFESYPNRDSLKYIAEYGLEGIKTMYRGTLRVPPFCKGWNFLVKAGLTREKECNTAVLVKDLKNELEHCDNETLSLLNSIQLAEELEVYQASVIIPSQKLQNILEQKWKMNAADKDMIVMVHQITFEEAGQKKKLQSSLVYIGKDAEHTAMATTVGLPVGMVTRMILNNQLERRGVLMPKYPEIYNPILAELKQYGITFKEKIIN